ncbi:MAG: hypothetical protein ACXAEE_12740 [Candidatus Thorarchaeota archaeon]|jgi:hypothetical protein
MYGLGSAESWSKRFQGISLLGLGLVPLMAVRSIMTPSVIESQSLVVGFSFITICLLGGIAGIRPSTCSVSLSPDSKQDDREMSQELLSRKESARRGHHYPCEDFSTHVLKIGDSVFCAGCTGLSTGAALAIIGSFFYFIIGVPLVYAEFVFWMGFIGVVIGIIQHNIYRVLGNPGGAFRFLLNVIFVSGAFLLLAGTDQLAGNITINSYILLVVLFWIYTRIVMSKSEHQRICSQCGSQLCHNS